jgi:hypothetical protein
MKFSLYLVQKKRYEASHVGVANFGFIYAMATRNLRAIRPYFTPHRDAHRTDDWKLVTTHLVDEKDPNSNFDPASH